MKKLLSALLAIGFAFQPVSALAGLKAVSPNAGSITGTVGIGSGGTGATTAGTALDNLVPTGGTATIQPQQILRTGVGNYALQNYFYYQNDPLLMMNLRGCLNGVAAGAASCNILFVGDSTTLGFGSAGSGDRHALSYPTQFANMLNAAGINASWQSWMGCGDGTSCSNENNISVGAGWTVSSGDITIGGFVASATAATSNFAFTPTVPVDTCTIYYVQNPSNGSFTWNYDGGSNTIISSNGVDAFQSAVVAAPSLGIHALNLNWSSGGIVEIIGTVCSDSSKKWVNIINAGWSGSESTQWATNNSHPWGIVSGPKNLGAAATITDLGINSWNNSTSVNTFKTNYQTAISDMPGDVILVTPAPSSTSSASVATQQAYVTATYQLAATNNLPLIDEYQRIGTYATASALTPSWYFNTLHPSATGYADFAGALYSLTQQLHVSGSVTSPVYYNNLGPNDATNSSIAIGASVLNHASVGTSYKSVGIGYQALGGSNLAATAINNIAIGYQAGFGVSSGSQNILIGTSVAPSLGGGSGNTYVGYNAGNATTSSGSNVGIGVDACFTIGAQAAGSCTAVGTLAGTFETGGDFTALGYNAAEFVSTGADNTALGYNAMLGITGTRITGAGNTCGGSKACKLFQGAAANNTVFGFNSASTTGFTGTNNVILGDGNAATLTTGSNNIVIGHSIDLAASGTASVLNIGGEIRSDIIGGAVEWHGSVPAVTAGAADCGTSPAIAGNNHAGLITVGSSTNGGKCTITFSNSFTFTNAPVCICQDQTTANLLKPVVTTTTLACTGTLTAADKISYICLGYF